MFPVNRRRLPNLPFRAIESILSISISVPRQPRSENPISSARIRTTFSWVIAVIVRKNGESIIGTIRLVIPVACNYQAHDCWTCLEGLSDKKPIGVHRPTYSIEILHSRRSGKAPNVSMQVTKMATAVTTWFCQLSADSKCPVDED